MEHLRKVVKKQLDNQKDVDDVYIAFGCDFAFTQAEVNYHNLDKVMKMWNTMYPDVELKYSNQKTYLETVKKTNAQYAAKTPTTPKSLTQGWGVRTDDAFPYAQRPNEYWSGFYTSRPHLKRLIKLSSSKLHSSLRLQSKHAISADAKLSKEVVEEQRKIFVAIGTLQHHDAITGTSVPQVSEDFYIKSQKLLT
jgi:hypothetical protein